MEIIPFNDGEEDEVDVLQAEYNSSQEPSIADINIETMDNNTNTPADTKKMVIVAILGVLIGFGVGFLVFGASNDDLEVIDTDVDVSVEEDTSSPNTTVDGGTDTVESVVVAEDVSFAVSDQNFGDTVILASLSLDRTSWVVVFEDNQGQPGSILGAQLYNAGEYSDVVVSLLRGTEAGSTYYVKLHSDNGDRSFDFTQDVAYLDVEGNEMMLAFQTTSGTPR